MDLRDGRKAEEERDDRCPDDAAVRPYQFGCPYRTLSAPLYAGTWMALARVTRKPRPCTSRRCLMSWSWFGSSNALSNEFCGPIAVTLKGGDIRVPFTMMVEPTQYTLEEFTTLSSLTAIACAPPFHAVLTMSVRSVA